jgi:hypothetical protein
MERVIAVQKLMPKFGACVGGCVGKAEAEALFVRSAGEERYT